MHFRNSSVAVIVSTIIHPVAVKFHTVASSGGVMKYMAKVSPEKMFVPEKKSRIFPSLRLFVACLLCFCFVALAVSTSNISQTMVCMVKRSGETNRTRRSVPLEEMSPVEETTPCKRKRASPDEVSLQSCSDRNKMQWTSTEQGFVYAAQNVGSLFMLITGWQADRLNSKYSICVSLALLIVSNALIPLAAPTSVWLVFALRVVTGMGDALLFPSASSLITRWFPPKERPFALGFVTGGRQIGTLLILPVAGAMCDASGSFSGWQSVFYLSAGIAALVLLVWLGLSADKPSKHFCISEREDAYIGRKVEEEFLGKRTERGNPPWSAMFRSVPLYVAVFALVCHEYPLVIMLQFLPKFFSDVLDLSSTVNGLVSALPAAVFFISKTLSSSLSSYLTARKPPLLSKTWSCRIFNLIASLGLGVCLAVTPLLGSIGHPAPAIIVLCLANAFAGLHTPGVQTALLQLAPAYSGIVTGIAFAVVAMFSIFNKLISSYILSTGSTKEWTIVFEISAVVALLPVVFFTCWGSADLQPWASPACSVASTPTKKPRDDDEDSQKSCTSTDPVVASLARYSMYLTHDLSSG